MIIMADFEIKALLNMYKSKRCHVNQQGIMSVERRGTKALELWARRATDGYPGVVVSNMTTAWRNGLAFCALIHSYRPDLIDFTSLKPENIYENNALAYHVAEQQLGIPALLDAEDMVETEIPDRLSVLTYVSQYYQAFAAQGLTSPNKKDKSVQITNNIKNNLNNSITTCTTTSTTTTTTTNITSNNNNKTTTSSSTPVTGKPSPPKTLPRTMVSPSRIIQSALKSKTDKVLTGGRGRREVCVGCCNPVFLAERMLVGSPGQLMHRTCFRCARCSNQLTLASYYETEKGQFCCETCPDEERNQETWNSLPSVAAATAATPSCSPSSKHDSDNSDSDMDSDNSDTSDDNEDDDIDIQKDNVLQPKEQDKDSKKDNNDIDKQTDNVLQSKEQTKDNEQDTTAPVSTSPSQTPKPRTLFLSQTLNDNSPPNSLDKDDTTFTDISLKDSQVDIPKKEPFKPTSFSQVSSALFGSSIPKPDPTAELSGSNYCDDAKGNLTNPPDALDTGQDDGSSSPGLNRARSSSIVSSRLKMFDKKENEENNSGLKSGDSSLKKYNDSYLVRNKDINKSSELLQAEKRSNDSSSEVQDNNIKLTKKSQEISLNNNKGKENITQTTHKTDFEILKNVDKEDVINHAGKFNEKNNQEDNIKLKEKLDNRIDESGANKLPTLTSENAKVDPQVNDINVNTSFLHKNKDGLITNLPKIETTDPIQNENDLSTLSSVPQNIDGSKYDVITATVDISNNKLSQSSTEKKDLDNITNDLVNKSFLHTSKNDKIIRKDDEINTQGQNKENLSPFGPSTYDSQGDSPFTSSTQTPVDSKDDVSTASTHTPHHVTSDVSENISDEIITYPIDLNPFGSEEEEEEENLLNEKSENDEPCPQDKSNTSSSEMKEKLIIDTIDETICNKDIFNDGENKDKSETVHTDEILPERTPDGKKIIKVNFNPFDSDDENIDLDDSVSIIDTSLPTSQQQQEEPNKKKCLNPFLDDDDDEDDIYDNSNLSTPRRKIRPPRPPPPTLPRDSSASYFRGSNTSINDSPGRSYSPSPSQGRRGSVPGRAPAGMFTPKALIPPPSPTPSAVSAPGGSVAMRIKKKHRPAPTPPSSIVSSVNIQTKKIIIPEKEEGKDEVLTWKQQKDIENQSKMSVANTNASTNKNNIDNNTINTSIKIPDIELPPVKPGRLHQKSESGEWRRKKGPAPPRPVPQKRVIRELPMRQVQQELNDIDVKQTELERQGVLLEQDIRARTESTVSAQDANISAVSDMENLPQVDLENPPGASSGPSSIEVEDMILQLFELVNEKNELFRRQTELMYLKREKRLEEEYAELEYQIRCLMVKCSTDKSDDDAVREEQLISRLVKIVEQRDEIINCLELDRLREAQEDESIASHMMKYHEKHIDGIGSSEEKDITTTKKKKKTLKLLKKKKKDKKKKEKQSNDDDVDADKDIDETETTKIEKKKKKKWFHTKIGS